LVAWIERQQMSIVRNTFIEIITTDDYLTECFSKLKEFKKVDTLEKK
jgi:hypothetical protein